MLTGSDGRVLLDIDEIDAVVLRAPGAGNELASHMFTLEWDPVDVDKPAGDVGAVLLIGDHADDDPLLSAVRSGLVDHAARCEVVSADDQARLRGALTGKDVSWDAIVVVCPPRPADGALSDSEQLQLAQARTLLISDIVKTLSRIGARNSPRLWIVTRGAQQLDAGEEVTLAQTPLRGIARVLTFEHPELKATIVDLDAEGGGSAGALVHELCADAGHDEVALRDGHRYVHRLVRVPTTVDGVLAVEPRPIVVDLDGAGAVRLQIDQPGRLDALSVHAVRRTPPQDDQVEIRVVAAGLNFSDVLKAMGVYPTLDGGAPVIGSECVGYVTARGGKVDSLEIGQRVIALGPGAFGSHLTTLADLVVPVPEGISDRQAATLGIAYLTAWYALREVGRLAPGERVLIHSATGGVGLAAVSIARMIGARIYTTAGSPAKRELLSESGVEYVGDSRSVEFAAEILDATDGYGVDVILNSLAGEAIRRGVEILAPGGRFVELGKKDVYADAQLGLAALAKSASFSVVDLDLNLRLQPQRYRRLLQDIFERLIDGELQMLPVTEFSLDNAIDAFRLMASGTHIGKIVISIPAQGRIPALAPPPAQPLVRRDGGYIVVGGMGGLGFVVARWLAQQGAGMVVLNGRSSPSAEVAAAIAEMHAAGSRVQVITGDIAEPDTAVRLVAAVQDAGLRPAGVLHSATVLADEIVLNMSQSAAARVFAPKVAGHWWLHQATAHLDLDWWLTFSSAASLLGSPWAGRLRGGELVGRWAGGLPALSGSAGDRDQLGSMGRGGTCPVLRRSGLLDDHPGAGTGRDATGAGRRPGPHRGVQSRCPAMVPILPRRRGIVVVRRAGRIGHHPAARRRPEPRRTRRHRARRAPRPARLGNRHRDPGRSSLHRTTGLRPAHGIARTGLADGFGTTQPARNNPGYHAASRPGLGIPNNLRPRRRPMRTHGLRAREEDSRIVTVRGKDGNARRSFTASELASKTGAAKA